MAGAEVGDSFDETQNARPQRQAMSKCPTCQQDYNASYPHCPYCAAAVAVKGGTPAAGAGPKKQSASGCASLIFLAIVLYFGFQFLGTLGACSSGVAGSGSSGLALQSSGWTHGQYGNRTIAGTVANSTGKTYGYVQVEINLYDGSGAQVGSTLANVNNLAPGAVWKFEAPVLEDSATRYEVKDITGF
jgi:hypothetical protein